MCEIPNHTTVAGAFGCGVAFGMTLKCKLLRQPLLPVSRDGTSHSRRWRVMWRADGDSRGGRMARHVAGGWYIPWRADGTFRGGGWRVTWRYDDTSPLPVRLR